jgi:hypothetical protein
MGHSFVKVKSPEAIPPMEKKTTSTATLGVQMPKASPLSSAPGAHENRKKSFKTYKIYILWRKLAG